MGITDMFNEGGEMEYEGGSNEDAEEDDIEEIAAKTMNNTMRTTKRTTKKKKKKKKGLTARKGFFGQTAKSAVPEEKHESEDEEDAKEEEQPKEQEKPKEEEKAKSDEEDLKEEVESQKPRIFELNALNDSESDAEEGVEVMDKGKDQDAMRTALSFANYKQTKKEEKPEEEEDADEKEEESGPKMADGRVTAANRSRLFN